MTVRKTLTAAGIFLTAGLATAGPAVPSFVLTPALAHDIVPVVPGERIKVAVEGLARSDYQDRERAHADILSLGEKAYPQLRLALPGVADPEARRRLAVILRKMEYDRMTTARRVTLVASRLTAPEAMRQIARQAGYRFRSEGLGDEIEKKRVYEFTLKDLPFWEAADAIGNVTGLGLQVEEDGLIRAFNQDAFNPHVGYSGPFRFVANQIQSNRFLQLGGLSRQSLQTLNPENLSLNLTAFAEPKSIIVGTRGPWVTKVVDESGRNVPQAPADQSTSHYGGGYRSYAHNLNLNFHRPAKEATRIKEIRAKAQLVLLVETRPDAVVPDLLKAKGKRVRGRSAEIEITEVTEANGTATISATITNPHGNANDYGWINALWQRFELTDAKGEKYQVNVTSTNYNSGTQVVCTFQAAPPDGIKCGPPATFTLVEWVTRSVDVEFTFKDLPLP